MKTSKWNPQTEKGAANAAPFLDRNNCVQKNNHKKVVLWQGRQDLNPQPSVLETDALPVELLPCGILNISQMIRRGQPQYILSQPFALHEKYRFDREVSTNSAWEQSPLEGRN